MSDPYLTKEEFKMTEMLYSQDPPYVTRAWLLSRDKWSEQDKFTARRIGLLKPKLRDGCSDYGLCKQIDKVIPGFSEAMRRHCDDHDDDYEIGKYSGKSRREADLAFYKASIAVVNRLGTTWQVRLALQAIRAVYFCGVRIGGPKLFRQNYSWGFGIVEDN
jgi:hypothetical protein